MRIVEPYRGEIEDLCKKHKVHSLYVFGSAATHQLNEESDIDFLVTFGNVRLYDYFSNFISFKESLEQLLGRKVDLVEESTLKNPILKNSISKNKQLIYG